MQAEVGTGLSMMAPARGSNRNAVVRACVRREVSVVVEGGGGIRQAGMLTIMLTIRRSWGGGAFPCAIAAALTSVSYRCSNSMSCAVLVSAARFEMTQNGRWCW